MEYPIRQNHLNKHVLYIEKFSEKRSILFNKINNQLKIERDLAFALGSISNLEEALDLCLNSTIHASGMDSGGIYLIDEYGGLRLINSTGLSNAFVNEVSYYSGDTERVKFIMNSNLNYLYYENYENFKVQFNFSIAEEKEALKSVAFIPIYSGEKVIALMNLASHSKHEISKVSKNIIENIAAQIGNIIVRIKAEEDFRKSEEKYRCIIEQSIDGIVMLDEKSEIIDWNRAMERITGLSRKEALGMPGVDIYSRFDPQDDHTLEYKQRIINQLKLFIEINPFNPPKIIEKEITSLDGKVKLIQEVNFPIKTGHSHMIGCVIRDITDVRQAEKRYKNLFENMPIGICRTLEDGKLIMANPYFYKMFGLNSQEELADNLSTNLYANPDDRKRVILDLKRDSQVFNLELKFKKKDGSAFWGELTSRVIYDKNSEASYLYSVISDITERKIIKEKLRHTQELFSLAFNHSPQWIGITTLEEGIYLEVNQGFCDMLGYSREEVLGKTPIDLGIWTKEVRAKFIQLIKENGEIKNYEAPFITNNGMIKQGLTSAKEINLNGEPCLISIVTDITDLRKLENEISRLDRLYLVGELAASIGHEIRNPLAVVRGFLQLMQIKKEYNFDLSKNNLDLMISELDRANTIITEFLSLAKGKTFNYKFMDINSIIESLLPLLKANAIMIDKNVKSLLENVPALLMDENEIRQLILNLVRNGLEAITPNKAVTIKTFIKGNEVVLAIQDEGTGINQNLLDRLGTPFLTTKETGAGIGLTICKNIAQRHNARINFVTCVNGTTVYVHFPTPRSLQ